MISDEEILIKKLRYCEQEYEQNGYLSVGKFKAIKEAVNLIEKQSKEIEELKYKIEAFIREELPDDEICSCCKIFDVNGVDLKRKLQSLLEGRK